MACVLVRLYSAVDYHAQVHRTHTLAMIINPRKVYGQTLVRRRFKLRTGSAFEQTHSHRVSAILLGPKRFALHTRVRIYAHTHARAITTLRNDVSAKCESDPRGLPMLLLLLGMPVSALVRGPIANGPHICWRFAVFLSACVSVCVCFYCLALATQTQANRNRCGQLARGTSGGWSGGLTYKFELVEPIEFD